MPDPPPTEPEDAFDERVQSLHEHLAATAELPIDRQTNRWLGEAEAVARDAATSDLDRTTTEQRVRQVRELLASAGDPDHDEAAEHLAVARELCDAIVSD